MPGGMLRTVDGGSWTWLEELDTCELSVLGTEGVSTWGLAALGIGETFLGEMTVLGADGISTGESTGLGAKRGSCLMALRSALFGLMTGLSVTSSLIGLKPDN